MENQKAFNPKTGEIIQYNPEKKSWDSIGNIAELPNDQKYSNIKDNPETGEQIGLNKFTKQWEPVLQEDFIDKLPLPNSVERGLRQGVLSIDTALNEAGLQSDETYAKNIAKTQKKIAQEPMSKKQAEGIKQIYESKDFIDFGKNVIKNPQAVGSMIGESLGSLTPGAISALGLSGVGKVAKAAPWMLKIMTAIGIGLGSANVEYTSIFLSGLQDEGIDTTKQEDVVNALKNKNLVDKLRAKATLRSIPVGVFDGLSMGIAGMPFARIAGEGAESLTGLSKLSSGRVLAASAGETAVQASAGAAGEAGAQIASEGKITSPVDVGLEAALEAVTALPEAAVQTALTTPIADLSMPAVRNLMPKGKVDPIATNEEVVGESTNKAKNLKKPLVDQVVDTDVVGSLSGFRNLVENIQPDELRIIGKDANTITGDLETDAVNHFNNNNMFKDMILEEVTDKDGKVNYQRAYHGSPEKNILEFNPDLAGKTTGVTAYGWGIYFSDNKQLADWYRKESTRSPKIPDNVKTALREAGVVSQRGVNEALNEIYTDPEALDSYGLSNENQETVKNFLNSYDPTGQLYTVELPENTDLLDNEAPLTKQPEKVKKAIENDLTMRDIEAVDDLGLVNDKFSGRDLYFRLQQKLGSDKAASKKLADLGIKGIKYENRAGGLEATNFVIFDPQAIKMLSTQYQRIMDKKFHDITTTNVFSINDPWDLAVENLRGLDLKNASPELKKTMDTITNRIRKAFGDKPAIDFYKTLQEFRTESVSNPVRGAQFLNNLAVSLDLNNDIQPDPFDTAMHEAWHWARRTDGFFTPRDISILENSRQRLINYVKEQTGFHQDDIDNILLTSEGRDEIEAWAFGLWASNKLKNEKYKSSHFTPMLNTVLNKVLQYLKNIGLPIKERSINDIFDDVYNGRNIENIREEGLNTNRDVRWQKINQAAQAKHQADLTQQAFQIGKEIKKAVKFDNNNLDPIGFWGKYINSMTHLAAKSNVAAAANSLFRIREGVMNSISKSIDAPLKESGYHSLSREKKDAIGNLADYLRKTKQRGVLDSDGYLTFNRDGKKVRLKDKELSSQYMALQKSYAIALQHLKDNIMGHLAKHFDLPDNFTKQDVVNKMNSLGKKANKEPYKNILDTLDAFDKLGKHDYVPRIRYGDFGIVVKDLKGNTVALYTLEKGKFKNKFNELQMREMQNNLQDKYSDTKKYKIYGKNGQITDVSNLDNIQPFGLTHNEAAKHIDKSLVSLDLLAGLIQSKDLNAKEFEALQKDLYSKVTKSGFAKHLVQSDDIDGYSTDWSRTQYAYEQGLSNYIGNLSIRDSLNGLQEVLNGGTAWEDTDLRDTIKAYVDYMGSPQEEYSRMRAFNYLWTMGGNLSTAILQIFTLPTLTLGNMMKFNSNILSNSVALNKYWWSMTRYFVNKMSFHDSNAFIHFDDPDTLARLVKDKVFVDDRQAKFNQWMVSQNYLGALLTEEYAGRKRYETRDFSGKFREGLSSAANFLGIPVSIAEQATRFTTINAVYEQLRKLPNADEKIMRVLGNDQRFLAQVKANPNLDLVENATLFTMDESHSVMGRVSRAPYQRGIGGALFVPFQGYTQNALESMARMWGQGKEGKIALATTLGSFMVFAGMLGLPGAGLLKELYEAALKATTGEEMDLDMAIREKIYNATGSERLGKFATQGILRAGGLDFSKRIGIPIPGEDLLLSILGIRGDASDILGVQGSVLTQLANAWNNYNNDASLGTTVASLSPTALANILKAKEYADDGVYTSKRTKLVDSKDLGMESVILRGLGFTSGEVADYRERNFYAKLLENRFTPYLNTQRERAKNHLYKFYKNKESGDIKGAEVEMEKYKTILSEVSKKSLDNKYPINLASFQRSVLQGAMQRLYPEQTFTSGMKKTAKPHIKEYNKVLGIKDKGDN